MRESRIIEVIRERMLRADDYDAVLERVGDARLVLIGEASHGTEEFYRVRAEITRLLIERKGFNAVAVEADWPDAYRVNRFVRGQSDDADADAALGDFRRFPRWMWRNTVVRDFVEWLREHNDGSGERRVGFYGLDLYSLHASIDAVIAYLDEADPEAAARARYRYGCFDHFGEDTQAYGYAAEFGLTKPCEEEVLKQLIELRQRGDELIASSGLPEDEHFFAEQSARLVKNAEEYYRTMFGSRVSSWNLRDRHMAETLEALCAHLTRGGEPARVVVWAHNSHLGDARATEMGDAGEWNLGQLARERWSYEVALIGFTTHGGTVTGATGWDQPAERKRVRPSLERSWERLFHDVGGDFLIDPREPPLVEALAEPRLERAIGVIYLPRSERRSHYFDASLPEQFDLVIHVDETTALTPLEPTEGWHAGEEEVAETYPFGV